MSNKKCTTCIWAFPSGKPDKVECHRNPPLVTGGLHCDAFTCWPEPNETDLCGEWANPNPLVR